MMRIDENTIILSFRFVFLSVNLPFFIAFVNRVESSQVSYSIQVCISNVAPWAGMCGTTCL